MHNPAEEVIKRRVINIELGIIPREIHLGNHRNIIITAYDDALLLCESSTRDGAQKLLDAGHSLELRDDRNEYITLASETISNRVRIILW